MSDRFNGQIAIGGILWLGPDEDEKTEDGALRTFLEAITDQGIGHDWEEEDVHPKNADELLKYSRNGRLNFTDSQASYGHFEDLEQKCIDLELPYDVYSDAYGEYGAILSTYRPDTGFQDYETDAEFNPITQIEPVRRAYKHLLQGQVHQALTLLEDVNKRVPPLSPIPPFEIKRRAEVQCPTDED